jgi:hypothetical protein
MSIRLFSFFLAVFVSPFVASGNPPSKDPSGGIHIRLLAEQAPEILGKVYLQFGETKSEAFGLTTNRLSDPIQVGERVMVLKTLEKGISLCTINLPDTGKSFAVVLVTSKAGGFNPILVRTDDPGFKAGDVFFINRSEKIVLGKLGTTPLILKPGETVKSRATGAIDNTYYDIAFATRDSTGDKLLSSSRWPVENHLRTYLFFFTNAEGRTAFRGVDEYLNQKAQ